MQDNKNAERKIENSQLPGSGMKETPHLQNTSPEELNEKIKNEPDTERLRSERQSVIDGEKGRDID